MKLFGTGTLGMFSGATDKFFVAPRELSSKDIQLMEQVFRVPPVLYNVGNARIVGAFTACNSNGIILPPQVLDEEIVEIRAQLKQKNLGNVNVGVIDVKDNALGNLLLVNDHGCIVSSKLKTHLDEIENLLGVPVAIMDFGGSDLVGSAGLVTNVGGVVHPMTTDDEIAQLSDTLKVPLDVSTVGYGIPFVGACAVANSHGAIVDPQTTGPELQRISEMLQL